MHAFSRNRTYADLPAPPPKDWYEEFLGVFDAPRWVSIRQKVILDIADYGPPHIAPTFRIMAAKSRDHFPMTPRTLVPEHPMVTPLLDSEKEQFNAAWNADKTFSGSANYETPIYAGLPYEIDPDSPDFRPDSNDWRMNAPLHPKVRVELEKFIQRIESKIPYKQWDHAVRVAAAPALDKLLADRNKVRKALWFMED